MTRLFAGTPFDIPPECELCGEPESACTCTVKQKAAAQEQRRVEAGRIAPAKQTAKIALEKRKGGRVVTTIRGLTSQANELPALLSQLQNVCGTGGTVKSKEDLIELQGDHVQAVRDHLKSLGYRVK